VNIKASKGLQQRRRRPLNRIDKRNVSYSPAMDTSTLELQLADRNQTIYAGQGNRILNDFF